MIKIFNANDRDFSTAGNIIIKPIKCNEIKKKSLNGWYIEVEVPIKYKDYISKDKLCVVKTKSKLNPQAFRIGEEINYTTRKIKFKAEHVMFDAKDYTLIDVRPTNQNGLNTLNYINQRTDDTSPFTMYSNVENINTAYFIRKNLLEAWTIIEERWGGVFDADNWNISFLTSVGNDNGETIAYGKNMQGFDIFEDWSSVCTKLCPVGYDGLMLPEQFLTSDVKYEKPYTRIIDFQTDLESEDQTEENLLAELRTKGEAYLEENKVPKVSYTIVSNINGNLEIGDTIKVLHPFVNIFTEVLEYEYNLISQKVVSLTFGNYSRDVKTKFENIKNTIEQVNQAISKQEVVINNQTKLINSLNKNGYVYIDENEILLLDTIPKEEAKNVWRFGLAGIGFSSNGYEGPFEIAITIDGQINANFITTGTMSVSRIEGLANFISETEKQIAEIEIEQGDITARVTSVETIANNAQSTAESAIEGINNIITTTGEAEGKNIHIEDSAEEPLVSIKVEGETTQETRSGKNKLPYDYYDGTSKTINGITFTVNPDKSITANGTATANARFTMSNRTNYNLPVGSYKLVGENENYDNVAIRCAYKHADGSVQYGASSSSSIDIVDGDYDFDFYVVILNGQTVDNITFYPMLLEATETDLTFEAGGLMPSQTYISSLINVEGRNKFTGLIKGIGLNANTGEEIINEKHATSDFIFVDFSKNPNYYLSGLSVNLRSYVAGYNANKEFIKRTVGNEKEDLLINSSLFSSTASTIQYIRVTQYEVSIVSGTIDEVDDLEIQLEIGEQKTEYIPYNTLGIKITNGLETTDENYKEQIKTFPLQEGQKLIEGSYLADDGIYFARKQIELDGVSTGLKVTNVIQSSSTQNYGCVVALSTQSKSVNNSVLYSSHFKQQQTTGGVYINNCYITNNGTYLVFVLEDQTITNLVQANNWLIEQKENGTPVIFEYELAEPVIEPYTEEQQTAWNEIKKLMTYKNVTNINSDAYLKIVYVRDNGLDIYETKQNASKKYTETTEKISEQKITMDGVVTQVSDITSKTDELTGEVSIINSEINTVKQTIEGWSQELESTGGNNIFYYSLDFWDNSNGLEEYSDTEIIQNSISQAGYILNNGSSKQIQSIKNGFYTCSFNYKKLLELAVCQVKINGTTYSLSELEWTEFEQIIEVTTNTIEIEFISDTDNSLYISDLMVNIGTTKLSWSQNANETRTDTVIIGKGIQVNSSAKNTYHRIDADGNRTFNKATGKVVNEATDKGSEMEELVVRGQAKINGLLIQKVSDQVWINNIL